MSIDHEASDHILANAHRPPDPDKQAAATRFVLACGAGDLLPMLGLDGAA